MFFWTESKECRRGVLEVRSRVINRGKTVLMAVDNVSLPADIVEMQFPKNLPGIGAQLVEATPAALPAA